MEVDELTNEGRVCNSTSAGYGVCLLRQEKEKSTGADNGRYLSCPRWLVRAATLFENKQLQECTLEQHCRAVLTELAPEALPYCEATVRSSSDSNQPGLSDSFLSLQLSTTAPFLHQNIAARKGSQDSTPLQSLEFGTALWATRPRVFALEPSLVHLNHGGYGGCLLASLVAKLAAARTQELAPQFMCEERMMEAKVRALMCIAKLLNTEPANLSFTLNTTAGMQTVLENVAMCKGDNVVCLRAGYLAVRNMLSSRCARFRVQLRSVDLDLNSALTSDAVVEAVLQKIDNRTRLVVMDWINSMTGFVFPVERVVQACSEHTPRIPVAVDGAHTVGQVPVDLQALHADFFVSSLHKWLCCAKSLGIVYVAPSWQPYMAPIPQSHSLAECFPQDFLWAGTSDSSSVISLLAALLWRSQVGECRIRNYCHFIAVEGARYLARCWKTEVLSPQSMIGALALVRLPRDSNLPLDLPSPQPMCKWEDAGEEGEEVEEEVEEEEEENEDQFESLNVGSDDLTLFILTTRLRDHHKILACIFPHPQHGLVCRVSGQIYLDMSHFKRMALALPSALRYTHRAMAKDV